MLRIVLWNHNEELLTPATEESKESMEETEVAAVATAAGGAATPKYFGTLPVLLPSWLTTWWSRDLNMIEVQSTVTIAVRI